eukprot:1992122-Pleurochrysis_carterae.AAC.10
MSVVIYFHFESRRLRSPKLRSTHARHRATPSGRRHSTCTPLSGHAASQLASTRVHYNVGSSFWIPDGGGAGALGTLPRSQGWSGSSPKPDRVRGLSGYR